MTASVLAMLTLLGCASPQVPKLGAAAPVVTDAVPADHCRIVVSRKQQLAGVLVKQELWVEGFRIGDLSAGEICTWERPVGQPTSIKAATPAGDTAYESISTPSHGVYFFEMGWYGGRFQIRPVPEHKARALLAGRCRPEKWKDLKDVTRDIEHERQLRTTVRPETFKSASPQAGVLSRQPKQSDRALESGVTTHELDRRLAELRETRRGAWTMRLTGYWLKPGRPLSSQTERWNLV